MELDFEEEREKEKNSMQLEIDSIVLEIPEKLIEDRNTLLCFETQNQNIEDLIAEHKLFLKCFLRNENGYNDSYNQRFIEHLNSELDIYR